MYKTSEGKEIKLKRIKVKTVKNITKMIVQMIMEGMDLYSGKEMTDDQAINALSEFILKNIELIEAQTVELTDLEEEGFDDLDVQDALGLIKALLEHNGLSMEKVQDFFQTMNSLAQKEKPTPVQEEEFIGKIPQV